MFRRSLPLLLASFDDQQICATLKQVDRLVGEGHVYEALKAIRALYPLEAQALGHHRRRAASPAPDRGWRRLMNVQMNTSADRRPPTRRSQTVQDGGRLPVLPEAAGRRR